MANELKPYIQRVNPDEAAVNRILTVLKKTLPDNGAFFVDDKPTPNLVDYVSLILGLGAAAVTRGAGDDVLDLVVSGTSFKLDTFSNLTSSDPSKLDNIADGISASLTALGVGLGVTILIAGFSTIGVAAGGVAVGFFIGNLAGGYINDLGDYWLGTIIKPSFDIEKGYTVFPTNSLFSNAIQGNWDSEGGMKYYVDHEMPFEFVSTHSNYPFQFKFTENKTFVFEKETLKSLLVPRGEFEELLKYLPVNPDVWIQANSDKKKIEANYLSSNITHNYLLEEAKAGDKKALYALLNLKPFVLKTDNYQNLPSNIYSDKYLEKRAEFLKAIVTENQYGNYYHDTDLNTHKSDSGLSYVNFGDQTARISGQVSTYLFGSMEGYSKNDTIKGSYDTDDYVEGLDGSDTIYTYGGNDTIYTNANISSQYDRETASTTNTVYAGDGDDKIYGSNGTDIIYGGTGADTIVGGAGADRLYSNNANSDDEGVVRGDEDILIGGEGDGYDKLMGGKDHDTYYASHANTIKDDTDGKGEIHFKIPIRKVTTLTSINNIISLKQSTSVSEDFTMSYELREVA